MNVKNTFRRLALTTAALALVAPMAASAQSDSALVNGDASAQVVAAIAIAQDTALDFGDIVASGTAGTVEMGTDGVRAALSGATLGNAVGTVGVFTVTGQSGALYSITLPADGTVTLAGSGTAMAVDGFASTSSGAVTDGSDTFNVGATLSVGVDQDAGSYSGTYPITVAYN